MSHYQAMKEMLKKSDSIPEDNLIVAQVTNREAVDFIIRCPGDSSKKVLGNFIKQYIKDNPKC